MSYTDFQKAIKSGVHRTNRWEVEFLFPQAVGDAGTSTQASHQAKTASIPDSTVGEIVLVWRGKDFPIPGDRTVQEFPVTFFNVLDMKVYDAFMAWSNAASNIQENTQTYDGDLTKITTNVNMWLLNGNNDRIKKFTLESAWVKTVSEISLDISSKDTPSEFTVNFRYLHVRK